MYMYVQQSQRPVLCIELQVFSMYRFLWLNAEPQWNNSELYMHEN